MSNRMNVKLVRAGIGDAAVTIKPRNIRLGSVGVRKGQDRPVPRHEEHGHDEQRKRAAPHRPLSSPLRRTVSNPPAG